METSLSRIKQIFDIPGADIRSYSPLTLAYIGDGIYELVIRTILVEQGNCQPQKLHKRASALVKAQAQSDMMEVQMCIRDRPAPMRRSRSSETICFILENRR